MIYLQATQYFKSSCLIFISYWAICFLEKSLYFYCQLFSSILYFWVIFQEFFQFNNSLFANLLILTNLDRYLLFLLLFTPDSNRLSLIFIRKNWNNLDLFWGSLSFMDYFSLYVRNTMIIVSATVGIPFFVNMLP